MDEQMNMQGGSSSGKFIFLIILLATLLVLAVVFGLLQYQSNTQLNQSLNTLSTQLQQLDQNQEELAMKMETEDEPVMVQQQDESPTFVQFIGDVYDAWQADKGISEYGAPEGMVRLADFSVRTCDNRENPNTICILPMNIYGPSDWNKAGDQEFYVGLVGGEPFYIGPFTGPLQEYVQDARRLEEIRNYDELPTS